MQMFLFKPDQDLKRLMLALDLYIAHLYLLMVYYGNPCCQTALI